MSMYDSLPKEAKDRVDTTVKTLEPLTWSDRRQKIGGLVMKMNIANSKEVSADSETPDPWRNPLWSAIDAGLGFFRKAVIHAHAGTAYEEMLGQGREESYRP